jgi:hypothetical protein
MVSPDSLGTTCLLSGRNSTYRPVQISDTTSSGPPAKKFGRRHQALPTRELVALLRLLTTGYVQVFGRRQH